MVLVEVNFDEVILQVSKLVRTSELPVLEEIGAILACVLNGTLLSKLVMLNQGQDQIKVWKVFEEDITLVSDHDLGLLVKLPLDLSYHKSDWSLIVLVKDKHSFGVILNPLFKLSSVDGLVRV